MKHIDSPTLAEWDSFTNGQLDGMLITWRWVRSRSDWASRHSEASDFIAAIEQELLSRCLACPVAPCPLESPAPQPK